MDISKFPKYSELTEIQKLRIQRGSLQLQKDRLCRTRFTDPPGVYGTAAANNSDARWQARWIDEKIAEIDHRITVLEQYNKDS